MSHLCTKQIECPNLVWTQYSINRYIARRQLRRGLEISAACALWSFTPTFALLLGLGYPTRDQGVPRRWPSAKQCDQTILRLKNHYSYWLWYQSEALACNNRQPHKLAPQDQMITPYLKAWLFRHAIKINRTYALSLCYILWNINFNLVPLSPISIIMFLFFVLLCVPPFHVRRGTYAPIAIGE